MTQRTEFDFQHNYPMYPDSDASYAEDRQTRSSFRRFPLLLVICLVPITFLAKNLWTTYQEKQSYEADYRLAQTNNQQAVEQNRQAQEDFQRLKDPNYLAEIARRDYYYSKDGELIFILPDKAKD